jgi:protein involved in polysaccharide export with SLBB domain
MGLHRELSMVWHLLHSRSATRVANGARLVRLPEPPALRLPQRPPGYHRAMLPACRFSLAIFLLLSGCATNPATVPVAVPVAMTDHTGTIAAVVDSPRLQAGEKIRVTVYGEASLSGDYPIDASGFVSLPLAGALKAEGLTRSELESQLAERFRSQYLRNPKVTVSVVEYLPFYIIGEIQRPGVYPYNSGLNILRAIAVAGGTTYRANKSTVEIQHSGESEMRTYPMGASIPVRPGDLIRIAQRYF